MFYAFPAIQIDAITRDIPHSIYNPLHFQAPHDYAIQHAEYILPLGTQIEFTILEDHERLEHSKFLAGWIQSIGITAIYKKNNLLYLLLDIPTLVHNITLGTNQ
jgi:hypothetical protein